MLRTEGPILGLIEDAEFSSVTGRIGPGDAVLLYTDGMVEEPRRDIDLGIDRMLGEMESLLRGDVGRRGDRLAVSLGSRDDDRALVVVHRLLVTVHLELPFGAMARRLWHHERATNHVRM